MNFVLDCIIIFCKGTLGGVTLTIIGGAVYFMYLFMAKNETKKRDKKRYKISTNF